MKLKQYENLSRYGFDEDGKVIELESNEVVPVTKKQYLLVTDEILLGVNIKRRFTADQIKTMYAKGTSIKAKEAKPGKQPKIKAIKPVVEKLQPEIAPNGLTYPYYMIMGEPFQSSREAAKVYKTMSYSTIRRKCLKNSDGWFEITGKEKE